ncbi:FdtA/QdtA family cupin domain-containing protein [Halomonas sp.]|uniref:sugar 3,4-ketoisomerase n=1 Tax=Halomonas sp. TaxID=1486246 RepID=UPI00298E0A75|nr:FdtA/QdtA family cupin domain-containing protein [Halomonas sp.]MDW7748696.1 FdtA/QdtA family cupin domain-containing protein [Halomonas sp.]
MGLVQCCDFPHLSDERGSLVALEANKTIPFEIKRVYYIYHTEQGVSRGYHAHKDLKQVAICVAGSCRIVLDDGHTRKETWLDCPTRGLLIESMIWREMHDLSEDCVLLVLASEHYDERDYIRNYEDFLKLSHNAHNTSSR